MTYTSHMTHLQDEYLDIVRAHAGDVASRKQGSAYLATTAAKSHDPSVNWSLMPKFIDKAAYDRLSWIARMSARIMEKATQAYLQDPSLREFYQIPVCLDELIRCETSYEELIPYARVDLFFNEQTGDFQLCEFNTDGSGGLIDSDEVLVACQKSVSYQEFAQKHTHIQRWHVRTQACKTIIETYKSSTFYQSCPHPAIAIVDYAANVMRDEVEACAQTFQAMGFDAHFVDIADLYIAKDEHQQECLYGPYGKIDCVWRRVVASDLLERHDAGTKAFFDAVKKNLACFVGSFRTWPCATKAVFAYLHSEHAQSVLNFEEQEFVKKHVPYTKHLTEQDDLDAFKDKDAWIVKPNGGYNSQGVIAGKDCNASSWQKALEHCAQTHGVIQAYAPQYATPLVPGRFHEDDALVFPQANNMEGLYLFHGELAGIFTRAGYHATIGATTERIMVASVRVDE